MKTVCNFDEDDPKIVRNGKEHLSEVLSLK